MNGIAFVNNNGLQQQSFINFERAKTKFTYLREEFFSLTAKILDIFERYVWPPIRETRNVLVNSLKIVILNFQTYSESLNPLIAKISATSFISFLFALKGSYSDVVTLSKNVALQDDEGVVLSAFSSIVKAGFAMGELNTSFTALEQGFGYSTFSPLTAAFKIISLPLIFGLLSYSVIRNIYN